MAHISTGVEYALHCLLFLVADSDSSRSTAARDLAELQGLPLEYVAKIFTKLQNGGLVTSNEGVNGGFVLARRPADISVLDVVVAVDGDKPLFECREIRERCVLFNNNPPRWATNGPCSVHSIMIEAEERMRETLANRSLADIAAMVAAKTPPEYSVKIDRWLSARTGARGSRRPSPPDSSPRPGKTSANRPAAAKRKRS